MNLFTRPVNGDEMRAQEQIRVTAAGWKGFISHLVLESLHQEVLGQVAREEDIWVPLVCKLPLQSAAG